jgi:ADP-ribosylglycohydrolase
MLTHIFDIEGDTDTIGSMAGAIWGAVNDIEESESNKYSF